MCKRARRQPGLSAGALNPAPPGVVRIDPAGGWASRIVEVVRDAIVPAGAVDEPGVDWESLGILDVSTLFELPVGSLFLADVQTHSLVNQDGRGVTSRPAALRIPGGLVEGGGSSASLPRRGHKSRSPIQSGRCVLV